MHSTHDTSYARGNLFFISIGAFCVGIFCCTYIVFPTSILLFLAGIILFSILFWFLTERYVGALISLACAFLLLGIWRTASVHTQIPNEFTGLLNTAVVLHGIVAADPDMRETNDRVTVRVTSADAKTKIIAIAPLYPTFLVGERVLVSGTLVAPQPFETDGGRVFRYDHFLAKDGVFALIQRASIKETGPPQGVKYKMWNFLLTIKNSFVQAIDTALPEPYASLAVGLIAGGKEGLGQTLLADFTAAGLLQIIVLSGYNVMIVAEGVLKAFSRFPKNLAVSLAALCIIGFVIAAGANSSAIRAGIMAILALFARATGRNYDVLRALTFSLFVMLLINPLLLAYDPGLQLSFLATLGLIIGSPLIEHKILWISNSVLREAVATSTSAQIAVLPILLFQSGNLSLVALPANILVMSAVPLAMAFSAISAIIAFMLPTCAAIAGIPAYITLWYIIEVAKVLSHVPLAQIIVPAFPAWFLLVVYAVLIRIIVVVRKRAVAPLGATAL